MLLHIPSLSRLHHVFKISIHDLERCVQLETALRDLVDFVTELPVDPVPLNPHRYFSNGVSVTTASQARATLSVDSHAVG